MVSRSQTKSAGKERMPEPEKRSHTDTYRQLRAPISLFVRQQTMSYVARAKRARTVQVQLARCASNIHDSCEDGMFAGMNRSKKTLDKP